ncbi:chemotaxis protein CheB [Azohydromonas caseinilytica]|uniref:protein-glutamate methylesterase n=1 Tax=Azohydromonas caseinilytica TaxID=2728836 RepID=A0A848FFJ2_9BURK|nr:chemotaxis protein CheB [Azohydromonas caseinilytica]NML18198.1 chemotaxis protein CheB [Azohydromonas caseinilytica]
MQGRVIAIGSSAHGIETLQRLVSRLPKDLPAPVLIAQHSSPQSPGFLPEILSRAGPLPAAHAREGEIMAPGHIYVAPPDRHLLLRKEGRLHLSQGPRENNARPAVDATFRSVALACGPAAVGVVLTGFLDDGTAGLLTIKDCGGVAVVQDPDEALAPSMPRSALRHVSVDHCCTIEVMASRLAELARDAPAQRHDGCDLVQARFENALAEGRLGPPERELFDRLAQAAGLNCPDCRSALYELQDCRLTRFRCRCGHAFSAHTLLSRQAQVRADLLASLLGALIEESGLARRLALEDCSSNADARPVQALFERADRLDGYAARLAEWIDTPVGE